MTTTEVSSEKVPCVRCGTLMPAAGERFCAACGAPVLQPGESPPPGALFHQVIQRDDTATKIRKARKWLMAIAVMTALFGMIFWAVGRSQVEKQIDEAERAVAGMDRALLDATMQEKAGMTFDEAVRHDRGQVTLLLIVNLGLSAAYLGLWWWARRKPYPAAMAALLLFSTVMVISAINDPKTLFQGVVVKIFFLGALLKVVSIASGARSGVPEARLIQG